MACFETIQMQYLIYFCQFSLVVNSFKGLEKFLGSATEGFIYFSLGTNVQSHLLTKNKIKIILETFKDLPYKVLWKYTSDDLPDLPKNVKIMKWVPQQDVLSEFLVLH